MAEFNDESLEVALDRGLKNAKHLRAVHAPTVQAARALARKIDAWDVIVDWALDDAGGDGRPAVPANDNVSLSSFLKYMDALGLTPSIEPAAAKKPPVKAPVDELAKFRAVKSG